MPISVVHAGLAALLGAGCAVAAAGEEAIGLAIGGGAGLVAAAVTLAGGLTLIRRTAEARRQEILRGVPPLGDGLAAATRLDPGT